MLLRLEDVAAGYGDVQALWNLSLEVDAGEIVALCGSNGAGKTTTLRVAMGLIRPRQGRVWVAGEDVTAGRSDLRVARGLALVPEGRQLFAGMSVRDNLLMGAYIRRDAGKVAEDLAYVFDLFPELRHRLRQQVGTMSGGEQQMVSIGRAIMARPRVLLVDELSLGLAPVIVDRLVELLQRYHDEAGVAIVLVEQDLHLALELADRAYVLEAGHLVRSGPAAELKGDAEIRRAYLGI